MAGIVYQQVSPHDSETVKITTIRPEKSDTVFLEGEEFVNREDKENAIAKVIGETNSDIVTKYSTMTVNGYANRKAFKEAFQQWEVSIWKSTLRSILNIETYIYTAMQGREMVGAAILVHLLDDFDETMSLPKASREDFPDPSDWKAVKAYSLCEKKNNEFTLQVLRNLNANRHQHGVDKVWELSGVGVKQKCRHQGIGSTLVEQAMSKIPRGHKLIMHAEPNEVSMYKRLGFRVDLSESGTPYEVTIQPAWMSGEDSLRLPVLIYEK